MKTRKKITLILALVVGAALAVPAVASAEPGLTPATVEQVLFPGQSYEVEKTVTTPEIPPEPEIYFLVDTTGSMGSVISQVKTDISTIIADITAAAPAAKFGLGQYKDFPYDAFAFQHMVSIGGDVEAPGGVDALSAGGGADGPEGQFFALDQLANTGVAGFTPGGSDIVVWIGDAPAHDPVCAAISGLGYDITEASVTADLVSADLTVVALSTTTGGYANGLDDDPTLFAGDYSAACGAPGGTAGQADRITSATGGTSLANVAPEDVAQAILDAIGAVSVDVSMTSNCEWPISTTFDPSSRTVVSGDDAVFTETISVAADAPGGTYTCQDWALIDGSAMTDASGATIYETKTIYVPEGFLTGGGQVGKGSRGSNFGGNVGYLADFSIVGQWQFQGTSDGDTVKMHSTSFDTLQFSNNALGEPYPPDANANVADFSGEARVKVNKDAWLEGCSFAAQAQDHGEPGRGSDVYGISIDCTAVGGDAWTFGREYLDAGNLQIHSGIKD